MAVMRKTQKDIGSYEAKFIGPFTMRQVVCIGIGIVPSAMVDYVLYILENDIYTIFGVTIFIMSIPLFFAFGNKFTYDMKPEVFLRDYYIYHILSSKKRLYETETFDDVLEQQTKREIEKSNKKNSESKNAEKTKTKANKKQQHKIDSEYPSYL